MSPPPGPSESPLAQWDVLQTVAWVKSLGGGTAWTRYAKLCESKEIDGATLCACDTESLVELGFSRIHALRVLQQVQRLQPDESKRYSSLVRNDGGVKGPPEATPARAADGKAAGMALSGAVPYTQEEVAMMRRIVEHVRFVESRRREVQAALDALGSGGAAEIARCKKQFARARESLARDETRALTKIASTHSSLMAELRPREAELERLLATARETEARLNALSIVRSWDRVPARTHSIVTAGQSLLEARVPQLVVRPKVSVSFEAKALATCALSGGRWASVTTTPSRFKNVSSEPLPGKVHFQAAVSPTSVQLQWMEALIPPAGQAISGQADGQPSVGRGVRVHKFEAKCGGQRKVEVKAKGPGQRQIVLFNQLPADTPFVVGVRCWGDAGWGEWSTLQVRTPDPKQVLPLLAPLGANGPFGRERGWDHPRGYLVEVLRRTRFMGVTVRRHKEQGVVSLFLGTGGSVGGSRVASARADAAVNGRLLLRPSQPIMLDPGRAYCLVVSALGAFVHADGSPGQTTTFQPGIKATAISLVGGKSSPCAEKLDIWLHGAFADA